MILLDTDHISILQWEGVAADRLRERLATSTDDWIGTTVITLEEQTRAAIARLGQARATLNQVEPCLLLSSLFRFFAGWRVTLLEEETASLFDSLRKKKVNISSSDLKIASIALTNNAIVLTAIVRDFEKVPGLRFENWLS